MFGLRWIKNSDGDPDAMLTFATVGFGISSLCIVLSMVESVAVGSVDILLKPPSETLVLGYMAAVFTSYVVRRNKKDHLASEESKEEMRNGILPEGE